MGDNRYAPGSNCRPLEGTRTMWPGITTGHDSLCDCTWAMSGGTYQVKVRNTSCLTHGGPLDAVLRRQERGRA